MLTLVAVHPGTLTDFGYGRGLGGMRLRGKVQTIFLMTMSLLSVSVPLFAHHGAAAFDTSKTITMKATVTDWFWANPHCFMRFDYKNDKGDVEHWVVETSNPPDMINKGWSKDTLKAGDQVTATVYPVKNGRPLGRLVHVVLADGKTLAN
jgi:hypothetical protein